MDRRALVLFDGIPLLRRSSQRLAGIALLLVLNAPAQVVPPVIQQQPEDLTIVEGDGLFFEVWATGTEPLAYQWRKNNVAIPGATDRAYQKDPATVADAGDYTVRVSNAGGAVTSAVARLTVLVPPSILTHPQSRTVVAGSNVTFSVRASGTPPLSYQWSQDGVPIPGATSTNLTILNAQPDDAGDYTVAVSNPACDLGADVAVSLPATLTVNVPPTILDQPDSVEANQGDDVVFSVVADGTDTEACPLTYQWVFKGDYLTGENDAILELLDVYPGQEGEYYVIVSNCAGSVVSSNVFLKVNTPPVFTLHPASRTVWPGSNMIFYARAEGTPPIYYQWYHNDVPIPGATNTNCVVWISGTAQRGRYAVLASNIVDEVWSRDAFLTVKAETVPPTVAIVFPTNHMRWSNSPITVRGIAADNAWVDFVEFADHYEPGGQGFSLATPGFTNLNPYLLIWTNWTATYAPYPGTNRIRALATDDSANRSATAEVYYFFVVPSAFTLITNGPGSASTNLGNSLEIGRDYTLTAVPGPGAVFTNWTGGYTTNHPTIRFRMISNLVLQMNFRDVQPPTVALTSALPAGALASPFATLGGSATDNWRVEAVRYQINDQPWATAQGTTNWSATVTLIPGTNTLRVYSEDAAGLRSPTNLSTTVVTLALPPPLITNIVRAPGAIHVTFTSLSGLVYQLEFKSSLAETTWTPLPPSVRATNAVTTLSDTNPPVTSRYYRVRSL
ncbi:MAG: immunoglobulin domain-containing protein [Verrucomicrobiales bacterium]|nr:immunoglobulin domain-containing protein [Verrucomicrobiales bacterium]